jgi:hypothetical protein
MKKIEVFGIITITILIIILIVHITSPTPKDKVFENQFVKFNYSSNLNLVDKSNKTSIFVVIYDGDPSDKNIAGTISLGEANKTQEQNLEKTIINGHDLKRTIISGYDAIVENMGDPGAEIYLNNNTGLFILVDPPYKSDVDTIINSLIIKKAPTDITSKTLFYEMNHQNNSS